MSHDARGNTKAKAADILWTAAGCGVKNARQPSAKHGGMPAHFGWEWDHRFKQEQ